MAKIGAGAGPIFVAGLGLLVYTRYGIARLLDPAFWPEPGRPYLTYLLLLLLLLAALL